MFSLYEKIKSKSPKNIPLEYYIQAVQEGFWQDYVFPARAEFEKNGKSDKYKKLKTKVPAILGCCVMKPGKKEKSNVDYMNGFLVLDIDEDISDVQYYGIKEDKYTHLLHKSISGRNYCNFIKIDKSKDFKGIFDSLCEYYYQNFNIALDRSCSNINRLRFVSYDPDLYYNEKSSTYRKVKKQKPLPKKKVDYVFTQSDFDNILSQIKERGIDLCKEDYFRYVQIGMSIANEFGESGRSAFHMICSFGDKYNQRKEDKTYTGFCRRANGQSTIGTLYYLCKQEGIDVYSEKTKTIINRVKVSKSQGKPTVESVSETLKVANEIEVNDEDKKLIQKLIDSKTDFSVNANAELSDIEQIENFIIDTFSPKLDVISKQQTINNDKPLGDREKNDIYLTCKKNFDFTVQKNDVAAILNSSAVKEFDLLKKFFAENSHEETGYIEKYASAITPKTDYNLWAFKRWIVGAIHNWMSPENELLVSPLTLVLSGQGHGIGKTSFLRNFIPEEMRKYFYEGKIDGSDRDAMFRLASNLVVFDDEFGGKGVKDVKAYKSLSDSNIITVRRPYGTVDESFKRRAVLCGTTNEGDVLKDVTGNRRILPIHVEKIDYDLITTIDHEKLIVEAYNLWKEGFDWKIYKKEDIEYLNENSRDNIEVLPVEEIFFKYFSPKPTVHDQSGEIWNQGEVFDFLSRKTQIRITKFDIKDIFVKNNLQYKTHRLEQNVKKGVKLYFNFRLQIENEDDEVPF